MELQEIVWGIIVGVSASIFSFILLWLIKPRIKVSKHIACVNEPNRGYHYSIKIVNTCFCFLYDVDYDLCLITESQSEDARGNRKTLYHMATIPFAKKESCKVLFPYNFKDTKYAVRLTIKEDLHKILEEAGPGAYLCFKITCKHSFSSSSKVFLKEYVKSQIRNGNFMPGRSTKIVNND